jgi:hypothetical protein
MASWPFSSIGSASRRNSAIVARADGAAENSCGRRLAARIIRLSRLERLPPMLRVRFLLVPMAALFAAPAAARPPVETPRLLANGWHYGEAGNYCMAIRELPGGERLSLRLAKWDDHSDSLILWAPGLPPLDLDDEAAAELHYGLEVRIDGRRVPRAMHSTMLEDFDDKPGPSYRLGIAQKAFIAALAKGRKLEIRRAGKLVRAFPIAGSAAMARAFAACVAKDPSF